MLAAAQAASVAEEEQAAGTSGQAVPSSSQDHQEPGTCQTCTVSRASSHRA